METDKILEDVQEEHPRGRRQLSPLAGVLVLVSTAGGNVPTVSPAPKPLGPIQKHWIHGAGLIRPALHGTRDQSRGRPECTRQLSSRLRVLTGLKGGSGLF